MSKHVNSYKFIEHSVINLEVAMRYNLVVMEGLEHNNSFQLDAL